jgi:hypothetical protein
MAVASDRFLRIVLRVVGLLYVGGYLFTIIWPSGWVWHPNNGTYLQMIFGVYATLGVFLWLAAREPSRHLSLIWFTVWSTFVHAAVMAVHAFTDAGEMGHLPGDVAALLIIAIVLAWATVRSRGPASAASRA